MSFGEGMIKGSEVAYFDTDHLGSVRVAVNQDKRVLERRDYYPFGAEHENGVLKAYANNRSKFNGKEKQIYGTPYLLDYGARMYYPREARWFTMDPLAEMNYSVSPYAFCGNNPVNRIDPDGMDWFQSQTGVTTWRDSNDSVLDIDGISYTNIGISYSHQYEDDEAGGYVNYYQNLPISISPRARNAEWTVLNNPQKYGWLLGGNSPLSEASQEKLFAGHIYKAQLDFQLGAARLGSRALQTGGDWLANVGYGASLSGLGAEAGVPLIALGNSAKYVGLGIEFGLDLHEERYQRVGYSTMTNGLMWGVSSLSKFAPGTTGNIFKITLIPFNAVLDYGKEKFH